MNDGSNRAPAGLAADGLPPADGDPALQSLAEALRLSFGILRLALFGLLIAYAFSGLFTVGTNEVALRLRFGDYVGRPGEQVLERGTYLAAPFPLEQVIAIDTRPQSLELDREFWYELDPDAAGKTRAEIRRSQGGPLDPIRDGSLLTGDRNLVHARWTVTYRVADPVAYLTNVGDPALARELVRCTIQQGIVHALARLPADAVLRAAVDRESAAGIARERLDAMNTGIAIDQLTLDEVSAPVGVIDAFEAVTSAETDRAQRIVAAEQDRARILGEAAGEASDRFLARIDEFDGAAAGERESVIAALDRDLSDLRIDGAAIGGEVARRINAAKAHRARVVEELKADRETFEQLLPDFEEHRRLVLSRLWEACRERIFTGDVETFYTVPGRLELQLNRDPEVQQDRQRAQLRRPGSPPSTIRSLP